MKMIDAQCKSCATVRKDTLQRDNGYISPCESCKSPEMERILIPGVVGATANVVADEIPGGMLIEHGICNDNGTPKRYYSKSAMRRAAQLKGLTNLVEHEPGPDSDKSKFTQRFIGLPPSLNPEDEKRRIEAWWAHEQAEGFEPMKPAVPQSGIIMGGMHDPHARTKAIIKANI